tara:strand:+ start:823 stop:978 length:156 start_codon:yes stop_codon:yes gene_type:complete
MPVSYFYEHDNMIAKDFSAAYIFYIPFLQVTDVQVVTVRLNPCIKKDPKLI